MLSSPGSANLIRAVSSQVLSISKDRDFTGFLCNLSQCLTNLMVKKMLPNVYLFCCNFWLLLGVDIFSVPLPIRQLKTAITSPLSVPSPG